MSRQINADVLIDKFEQEAKRTSDVSFAQALMYAVTCIEHEADRQPTIEQPKWISCAERLPEVYEDVLVYDDTAGEIAIGCLFGRLGGWVCVPIKNKVTHWMPLPQPPKEGE